MVHTYSGILLGHKRNTFESVLMRWMNLQPIMQSELRKRKKNHILTHIHGIKKDSTDKSICKAAMDTQT